VPYPFLSFSFITLRRPFLTFSLGHSLLPEYPERAFHFKTPLFPAPPFLFCSVCCYAPLFLRSASELRMKKIHFSRYLPTPSYEVVFAPRPWVLSFSLTGKFFEKVLRRLLISFSFIIFFFSNRINVSERESSSTSSLFSLSDPFSPALSAKSFRSSYRNTVPFVIFLLPRSCDALYLP